MKSGIRKPISLLLAIFILYSNLFVLSNVYAESNGKYIIGDGSGGGGGGSSATGNVGGAGGNGGGGDDIITGSSGDDIIFGDGSGGGAGCRAVSGTLNPRGGNGGSGNDIISGGAGDDVIFGDGFNGEDYGGWFPGKGGLGGGGGGGAGGNFGTPPNGAIGSIGGGGGGAGGSGASVGGATLVSGIGAAGNDKSGDNGGSGGNAITSDNLVTGAGGAFGSFAGGGGGAFGGAAGGNASDVGTGDSGANGDTNQYTYSDGTHAIRDYFNEAFLRSVLSNYPKYGYGNDIIDGGAGNNELFGLGGTNTFIVDSADGATRNRIWDIKVGDKLLLKNSGTLITGNEANTILDAATYADYDNDGLLDDTRLIFNHQPIDLLNIILTKNNNQGTNGEISPANSAPIINLSDSITNYPKLPK